MEMDEKMDLFLDKEIWEQAVSHGVCKHLDKSLLNTVCSPYGRLAIAEAIEQGRYKIQPPTVSEIPKPNGKVREVYANTPMDRLVLTVINAVYYRLYSGMIHPSCVSYQKGKSVPKIIRTVTKEINNSSGYKADLSKYFDSVNIESIDKLLTTLSTNSPLDKVVWDYYHDNHVIIKGKLVERYKSLAQGCALGTLLANLVLRDLDRELSQMDIVYYRYSDDLLIIGKDADKALQHLKDRLHDYGLSLNPKKVEKIEKDKPFTFLGAKITGKKIEISDESVERYKKKIREICKIRKKDKPGRVLQRRCTKKINNYLRGDYERSHDNFGWDQYFFSLVNDKERLIELDEFTKDHIKHLYTGKWNHTTNMHKTSNEQLREMGYKSLSNLYDLFKTDRDLYTIEIRKVG